MNNTKWIEKIIDNRVLFTQVLLSLVCFLLGVLLFISGLVKYFPPINPYGIPLSNETANVVIVTGVISVTLSMLFYFWGTKNTYKSAQEIRGGISYMYLRQYLSVRVDTKFNIMNNSDVLPTPKSVANISYLLNETNSELSLLRCLGPHLLLLLDEESDDRVATEIVEIIGKIKIPNTEKVFVDYYRKDYLDLRIACVTALGELGTIKSRRCLEKLLSSSHNLDGRLLNAINTSLKKLVIPFEYVTLLKNQLFDEKISKNIRETYVQAALEELGTKDAKIAIRAYRLSKVEGLDIESAYQQITSLGEETEK